MGPRSYMRSVVMRRMNVRHEMGAEVNTSATVKFPWPEWYANHVKTRSNTTQKEGIHSACYLTDLGLIEQTVSGQKPLISPPPTPNEIKVMKTSVLRKHKPNWRDKTTPET